MSEEQIALAKRAVACKGWRWLPGMADCWGGRVREGDGLDRATAFPDLTDPATLGCLLALVREARGEPTYLPTCLDVHDEAWVVRPPGPWRQTRYESYASVLLAALEAAPVQ
jgi:hypothetical protein